MADKKILYVTQEIFPYLSETPESKIGGQLPQAIQGKGYEVRTFMPKYGNINERRNQLHEVIRLSGKNLIIDDTDHPLLIKVASLQPSRIQVYFIYSDDFFQKSSDDIDEIGSNRHDNDERAMFFARGSIETIKNLNWKPLIVHCSGWVSALVPLYLRKYYSDDPFFNDIKIVYTIFPGSPELKLDQRIIEKLKMDNIAQNLLASIDNGEIDINSIHKLAIDYSDAVICGYENIDAELLQYVETKNLPLLSYEEASKGVDTYNDFYNRILPNNEA